MEDNNQLNKFLEDWKDDLLAGKIQKMEITVETDDALNKVDNLPTTTSIASTSASNSQFRRLAEPKISNSDALNTYIKATQYERMGNLSSALQFYRQALRQDENVEREYRKFIQDFPDPQKSSESKDLAVEKDQNEAYYTYYNFIDERKAYKASPKIAYSSEFDELVCQIRSESPEFVPITEDTSVLFDLLPDELTLQCIKWICLLDIHHYLTLSLVCKKMLLFTRETSLWVFLCKKSFPPTFPLIQQVSDYCGDWYTMYLEKPRVKWHGVYISRVNYLRQGYNETFNQPIHLITYYRYFRFYPNGDVASVTSTIEPFQMVKQLSIDNNSIDGYMRGVYTFRIDNIVEMSLTDPKRPKTLFNCSLKITTSKQGRHNKLSWIRYHTKKRNEPGTESEIPLATLKPFQFSKVKSYIPKNILFL